MSSGDAMSDLIFIALAVGLFAACAAYVSACARLLPDRDGGGGTR
jgi:hypothetical protein